MNSQPSVIDFMNRFPNDDACLDHLMEKNHGKKSTAPDAKNTGNSTR